MSDFKIEDKIHYFNYVKSILKKKDINIYNCDYNNLRLFCDSLFEFSTLYEEKIRGNDLRTPMEAFTYLLYKGMEKEIDVFRIRNIIETFLVGYKSFVIEENIVREKYRRLYEFFYFPSPKKLEESKKQKSGNEYQRNIHKLRRSFEDRNNYLNVRGLEYSGEFMNESENVIEDAGIYIFYGEDKETVFYVGKSTSSLGKRMASSAKERKGIFYFSYAITENGSETSIYEMYYIAKLKPILNVDGNYGGSINIVLPDLKFSEIKPLYTKIKEIN